MTFFDQTPQERLRIPHHRVSPVVFFEKPKSIRSRHESRRRRVELKQASEQPFFPDRLIEGHVFQIEKIEIPGLLLLGNNDIAGLHVLMKSHGDEGRQARPHRSG